MVFYIEFDSFFHFYSFILSFFHSRTCFFNFATNKKLVGATRDNLPPKKLDVSSNFHQILSNRKLEEWPETTFLVKNSTFPSISFKFHKSGDRISSPCFVGTKLGDEILPPLLCFKIDQNRPKSTKIDQKWRWNSAAQITRISLYGMFNFHRHFWKVATKFGGNSFIATFKVAMKSPGKWRYKSGDKLGGNIT